MGGDEYRPAPSRPISAAEKARLQREVEDERRRAAERAAEAERARQAAAARPDTRSPEARLLAARCSACHPADVYAARSHGWLGWHAVVLRMRWLNGAALTFGEQTAIVAELRRQAPARPADEWREWLCAALVLAGVGAAAWRLGRRLRGAADPGQGGPWPAP
jgi:hypothetical protein